MWTILKNNYKTILLTIVLLLLGIIFAFIFEDYYRQLVRISFKYFNGDKIQFSGKNFHLYASYSFVIAFGLFTTLIFLLLKFSSRPNKIKRVCLTIFIFFATTFLTTALDSTRLVVECTACNEGIRILAYNELSYDNYFIISLTTAIAYLIAIYLLERKQLNKTNEII